MRRSHLEWLQTSSRLRRSYVFEHVGWPCLNEVEEGAKDTSDGSMTYTKKKKKKNTLALSLRWQGTLGLVDGLVHRYGQAVLVGKLNRFFLYVDSNRVFHPIRRINEIKKKKNVW